MVRAPGRVIYMPMQSSVGNPSPVNAHKMSEFMAFRKEMRQVNCYKCCQCTLSMNMMNKDNILLYITPIFYA